MAGMGTRKLIVAVALALAVVVGGCSGPARVSFMDGWASEAGALAFCTTLFGSADDLARAAGKTSTDRFVWMASKLPDRILCKAKTSDAAGGGWVQVYIEPKPPTANHSGQKASSATFIVSNTVPWTGQSNEATLAYLQSAVDRVDP